jgi:succinoglycan biosynthesis transport protein ExoP
MSHEMQLRPGDGFTDGGGLEQAAHHAAMESPIYKVHRALRRRYKWAILLGLGLGAGGAFLGYKSGQKTYSSSGVVQIRAVVQSIMNSSGQSPDYSYYVGTQMAIMRSQRVAEMALQSADWKALGHNEPLEDELTHFMTALSVVGGGGSELITISYADADPRAASAAVKGVIDAYDKIRKEREVVGEALRRQTLEDRSTRLSGDRNDKRTRILDIAKAYGSDDLTTVYTSKLQEQLKAEELLNDTGLALAASKATTRPAGGGAARNPVVAKHPKDMTFEEIASVPDAGMRQLLNERQTMEDQQIYFENQKLGANHPQVVLNQSLIEAKTKKIENYAARWRAEAEEAALAAGIRPGDAPMDPASLNRQILENKERLYREMAEKLRAETLEIGGKMLQIKTLRQDEEALSKLLGETTARLDQLDIESRNQPRVEIINASDPASRPLMTKDTHKNTTIMGGVMGFGLGFGLIVGLSLLDRRFRSPLDARTSGKRLTLLGVLPNLPDDLADPDQAAIAAHCVHQIRTLLQIGGGKRHVFSMTSPAAGTGKTSLTLALGVSFAASNARVLMIDCDVVGGGLTVRVNAIVRRRIGQILRKQGLLTQQHFEEAMKLARHSQKRIGEVLVELGRLTQNEVDRALTSQDDAQVGLLEALNGEDLDECVAQTGIEGLSILPLGHARPGDVSKISPVAISNLIGRAREHYDIILIDTGPIPGSLEASAVASAVDGVVLVVSRGEHRPLAERSIQHLNDIGAPIAGMVFNRAETRDIDLASTTIRFSSIERNAKPPVAEAEGPNSGGQRFGPVATAVASRTPEQDAEDEPS